MTTMKKKRLGRGLGSLIGNLEEINQASDNAQPDGLAELDIDRIQRGKYQPRQVFEQQALQELADSIRAQGIVQPIVVRPEGNHFELIAGDVERDIDEGDQIHRHHRVFPALLYLPANMSRLDLSAPLENSVE